MQQRGDDEVRQMVEYWPQYVQSFQDCAPEWFAKPQTIALAERLASSSVEVAGLLSPSAQSPFACMVHGDYKAMNTFLPMDDEEGVRPALLIDFQWTSVGFGMMDVAMHLFHSVSVSVLEDGGVEALLRLYYEMLCSELVARGHDTQSYTWEVAMQHYRLAVLDYARIVFGAFFRSRHAFNHSECNIKTDLRKLSAFESSKVDLNACSAIWPLTLCVHVPMCQGGIQRRLCVQSAKDECGLTIQGCSGFSTFR